MPFDDLGKPVSRDGSRISVKGAKLPEAQRHPLQKRKLVEFGTLFFFFNGAGTIKKEKQSEKKNF